jgi:hypothetical protein
MTNLLLLLHLCSALLPYPPGPPPPGGHPLKMCVCDVKYLPGNGQLSLKFKFFWDDLEMVLEKKHGQDIDLRANNAENALLLDDFVKSNFNMKVNGVPVGMRYVSAKFQDPVLQAEWVSEPMPPAERYVVDLRNQILLDVFPDQYNLVRFDFFGDGNLETMRFERSERELRKTIAKK